MKNLLQSITSIFHGVAGARPILSGCLALVVSLLCSSASFGAAETKATVKPPPAKTALAPVKTVNINTASAEELAAALNGVGMRRAKEIVAYRNKVGGFSVPEQLTDIKGIGPKLLERNRARMVLE